MGKISKRLRELRRLHKSKLFIHPRFCDGLVYTMGKVGGTSIHEAVSRAGLSFYHLHRTNPSGIEAHIRNAERDGLPVNDHIIHGILARNAAHFQERIDIVTSVRDPISRNLSAIFETIGPERKLDIDEIAEKLGRYRTDIPDQWFRQDFLPFTSIDVFAEDIDPAAGHHIFERGKFRVLLVRLEDGDGDAIGRFVGARVSLRRANAAKNKWYADVHAEVRNNLARLAPGFVESCLKQQYFQMFYSEAVRNDVLRKYRL